MMKQRQGAIVNIASIVGVIGNAGQANYSASKAGLIGLTKTMARELAPRNITVNAIAPGFIDTEMTRKVLGEQGMREMAEIVPIRRMGNPEEVARLVLWLASDENTFVSAQNIAIDGGYSRV